MQRSRFGGCTEAHAQMASGRVAVASTEDALVVIAGARTARAADLRAVAMDVVQTTATKDVPPGALK